MGEYKLCKLFSRMGVNINLMAMQPELVCFQQKITLIEIIWTVSGDFVVMSGAFVYDKVLGLNFWPYNVKGWL